MELKIAINMDNAAFDPARGMEAARILRRLARRIEGESAGLSGGFRQILMDINGNRVGVAEVEGEEEERAVREWDEEAEHANDLRHESRVADEQERRGE